MKKSYPIWQGKTVVEITEKEIRNAQRALLNNKITDKDRALIDAVLSYYVRGKA